MRQRIRSHLTYANVISTLALFLVLGGGTTLAATGGNFILGQANTAGAPTKLSSLTTDSAGALKVTNTNTTTAGRGISALGGAGGFGLWASGGNATKNTAAIHGQSTAGNAVEGISGKNTASGVYGQNDSTGYGVAGRSTSGTAVLGDSSDGWAFNASGNATQARAGGGFVKAMALVNPGLTDHIQQCFNSQLPASQAKQGDCGITYSSTATGTYNLDFGFQVNDRFASATGLIGATIASAEPSAVAPNRFTVVTFDANGAGQLANTPFFIIVF